MESITTDFSSVTPSLLAEKTKNHTKNPDFHDLPHTLHAATALKDGQPQRTGDTVSISQEGRDKAQQSSGELFTIAPAEAADPGTASPKDDILRQIKEIEEKLQDARGRLAEAQGNSQPESSEDASSLGPVAATLTDENPEMKAIQAEIEQLSQQLLMCNDQLMELTNEAGGGSAGGIRAGIGGASNGPSGQGQRIQVQA